MSGRKKYSNFDQIDKDLKRLHLQSEISKEELKLSFYETKESITPGKVVTSVVGGVATSAALFKILTPVISFGIGKLLTNYESRNNRVVKKPWYKKLFR